MFIPDSFGNGSLSGGVLSRIGGREVKVTDVERDTQRLIDEVRATENRNITPADAAREGRVQGIIQDIEVRNTLLAYADKTGVQASDASLKPYLERNKLLVDEFGKLSRDQLLYQAAQRRQSPREFEEIHQGLSDAGLYPRSGGRRSGSAGDPVAAVGQLSRREPDVQPGSGERSHGAGACGAAPKPSCRHGMMLTRPTSSSPSAAGFRFSLIRLTTSSIR